MNLREEFEKVINLGVPIRVIARIVGKDSSTLGKWMHGHSNLGSETEQDVYNAIVWMKKQWENILKEGE